MMILRMEKITIVVMSIFAVAARGKNYRGNVHDNGLMILRVELKDDGNHDSDIDEV